jgi:hypothetical protein
VVGGTTAVTRAQLLVKLGGSRYRISQTRRLDLEGDLREAHAFDRVGGDHADAVLAEDRLANVSETFGIILRATDVRGPTFVLGYRSST